MPRMIGTGLSRREREILEILHRLGRATVSAVLENLKDPPSYSAVRSILRILEQKGHARHIEDGKRYLYAPVEGQETAARSAIQQVVLNFFGGSLESAVNAFLTNKDTEVSQDELKRLADLIEMVREEDTAK